MSKIWDAVLGPSLLRVECFRILEKACIAFSFKCSSARVKFPVGLNVYLNMCILAQFQLTQCLC